MIQLINRYCLICIFLCAPFLTKAQLHKADSLFGVQEYYLASLEYERVLFRNKQPSVHNQVLLKKTYCLKAIERYEEGYRNLLRADLYSNSDSLNYALRYELILNAYLAESYDIAYNHFKQLNHFIVSEDLKTKTEFLEILILNEMQKWDEGKEKLLSYNDRTGANFNVDSLYKFIKKPKIRNIKKTETLAAFAPGLVQVREGKVFQGLFSAAARGSLVYIIIDQLGKHYFFSGALTATTLYFLFYQGGMKYAILSTKKGNQRKIKKYNHQVRNALINYEISIEH